MLYEEIKKLLKEKRGFTLIELLVVIAIIGLLLAINTVAIFHYRDKAKDSRIQAVLSQVRNLAAMIYNDNNTYEIMCDAGHTLNDALPNYPGLATIETDVKKLNKNQDLTCYATVASYCVSTPCNNGAYCVDFVGYAGTEKTTCDASAICN